jgi:hypothetical protein
MDPSLECIIIQEYRNRPPARLMDTFNNIELKHGKYYGNEIRFPVNDFQTIRIWSSGHV